jgi:flavin reductase (DIM6/NTAB) family NADH-FMN oxidoreductase RutF
MTIEVRAFRDLLGRFPTGVTVITMANGQDELYGVTIGSFASVSLEPPLVLFCLDRGASCHAAFSASRYFAVNILGADQFDLSRIFSSDADRPWESLDFERSAFGTPLMAGCLAHLECETEAVHAGGDHEIIVGKVVRLVGGVDGSPLLHFNGAYRRLEEGG